MNRLLGYALIVIAVSFIAAPVSAEIYQYHDAHGRLHFTDNIGKVPKAQRSTMKVYKELKSKPGPAAPGDARIYRDESGKETWSGKLVAKGNELEKEKNKLDREYNELRQDKAGLGGKPPESASPEQKREYAEKVSALNTRIDAYDRHREKFRVKVDNYMREMQNPGRTGKTD